MFDKICLTLSRTNPCFKCLQYKSFEKENNEQFLLFSVFSTHSENFPSFISNLEIVTCKLFQFGRVYNLLFGKGLILYKRMMTFDATEETTFENIMGKGEIAVNQHFLPSPIEFSSQRKTIECLERYFISYLQMLLVCTNLKFCCQVKS